MHAGPVVAIFTVFGLAIGALARSASTGTDERYRRLQLAIQHAQAGTATPAELFDAAALARQLGQQETADRLFALATSLDRNARVTVIDSSEVDPRSAPAPPAPDAEPAPPAPPPAMPPPAVMPPMTSPIPEATDEQWRQFVTTLGTGNVDTVTHSYNLGIFRQGFPTLEALKVAANVRRGRAPARGAYDGEHDVWVGDFIEPLTLDAFLADPALQYRLFARNVQLLRTFIAARHGDELKTDNGKHGTASGMLAVALVAGPAGFEKWWTQGGGTHPNTDHAFAVANNLF